MTKKTSDWEIVEESIPTAQVGMLIPPMGQQYMSGRTGDIINTPKQIPLEKNEDVLKIRKDKKEQQLQRVGYSQKEAKALAQHPKLLESAEDRITDREYKDYRISMHPDYNPNKSFEEQETLLSDNSLRTRVLRGRNTLTTSGSPAGNFATGLLTAPGSSFANMTMDAENRYVKPGVKQGLMNFGLDALDVFPTATGGLVNKSVNKVKGIINNGKILKQHWLKGYKEIPKPKSNFKSEIDWAKWNKEIPDNPSLLNEYNTIEQTSKTNGSWMKNADGSEFQGTPEQFIQQNSSNFKKSFGKSKVLDKNGNVQIAKHTTRKKFDEFDMSKFGSSTDEGFYGKGMYFHPKSNEFGLYGDNEIQAYLNIQKPASKDVIPFFGRTGRGKKALNTEYHNNEDLWKGKYDGVIADPKTLERNYMDFNDTEYITNIPSNIKSAVGNNGMFNMTNPNIYKALVPATAGVGVLSQQETPKKGFKNGGRIESDWEIIN